MYSRLPNYFRTRRLSGRTMQRLWQSPANSINLYPIMAKLDKHWINILYFHGDADISLYQAYRVHSSVRIILYTFIHTETLIIAWTL